VLVRKTPSWTNKLAGLLKNSGSLSFCPEKYADIPADNGTFANLA